MWRDVQDAFRSLARSPGFTITVTVSLALAIGANATIFGAVDALWLRPPGARDPGELVRIFPTTEATREGFWSYPEYEDVRDATSSFSGVAVRGRRGTLLHQPDGTSTLELVNVVSLNFFEVLGIAAATGRVFGSADEQALERTPGIVLGYDFWQRQYGGDPSIVGRTIRIGRTTPIAVSVLGVLPERFRELEAASNRDLWLPPSVWVLLTKRAEFEQRDFRWLDVVARRRPGVSVEEASAEVATVMRRLADAYPATNRGRSARVISDIDYRLETGGVNALALLGLVLLVVVVTCVNVANLQLARGAQRVRELGVRTALGASRGRLLRQLMTENVVLGALGAAAGLLAAAWVIRLLPAIIGAAPGLRAFEVFALDERVFTFTIVVALVTTVAFGVAPSWLASRPDVASILRGDANLAWRGGRGRLRRVLVTGQVAVAIVMMTAAVLFAQSFAASNEAPLGFARKPILTAWVFADLSLDAGEAIVARLRGVPGVRDVAVARRAPLSLSGAGLTRRMRIPETMPDPAGQVPELRFNAVSANYFQVLGIHVLDGRVFTDADQRGGEPVVIVSDAFARRFFPGTGAVGHTIRLGDGDGVEHRVIGVVDTVTNTSVGEEPEPYLYVPYWRESWGGETTFLLEAQGDAAALAPVVRATLREADPTYDPRLVSTLDELVRFSARNYRWTALLASVLGALGLLLTALGVYGLVSFDTTRQTREIGIRVALGAARRQVLGLVLRDGMRLALGGTLVGVPASFLIARLLSSLLFGVSTADARAFAAAVALVLLIVLLATIVPARRAVRVTPSTALRNS